MRRGFLLLVGLIQAVLICAQSDSILHFSNLTFNSAFEQKAFLQLQQQHADTLDAFLAVDEKLNHGGLEVVHRSFTNMVKELDTKNFEKKNAKFKVKMIFATVKSHCQTAYNRDATLTSTLLYGQYNEWTLTPIVAMLLDRFRVPYKLFYSLDQLRFVANPGPDEELLEASNPIPIVLDYPFEYRKKYVDYLHGIGAVTDADMRLSSIGELFDERSRKEKELSMTDLLGLGYYDLANSKSKLGNYAACLIPSQKGFYLYPSPELKIVLLNGLSDRMNHLVVNESADIDYLIQYYQASGIDAVKTNAYFSNVITKLIQNPEKVPLCDSIYQRFILQVKDQKVLDEVGFSYNVMRINQKNLSYKDLFFVDKAACIQPGNKDLCNYAEFVIVDFLRKIEEEQVRKDSIESLSTKLKSNRAQETLKAQGLVLLLDMAQEAFKSKKPDEGEKLLQEFETSCPAPVKNETLLHAIELAYYDIAVAVYWGNKQDYAANARMIQRGMQYLPDSELLKSGAYVKKDNPVTSTSKKEKVYSFH
jgi:hypothetical protein